MEVVEMDRYYKGSSAPEQINSKFYTFSKTPVQVKLVSIQLEFIL